MIRPLGGVGAGTPPVPVPTKLVTLEARRVAEKLPPDTVSGACWAKLNELEVTHGVTEPAARPFKVMFNGVSDASGLMATMTNARCWDSCRRSLKDRPVPRSCQPQRSPAA